MPSYAIVLSAGRSDRLAGRLHYRLALWSGVRLAVTR